MRRRARELVVIAVLAGALTAFAVGQTVIGFVLVLVVLFIGRRLWRHGRIIGIDQRAADAPGPATVRGWTRRARRLLRI